MVPVNRLQQRQRASQNLEPQQDDPFRMLRHQLRNLPKQRKDQTQILLTSLARLSRTSSQWLLNLDCSKELPNSIMAPLFRCNSPNSTSKTDLQCNKQASKIQTNLPSLLSTLVLVDPNSLNRFRQISQVLDLVDILPSPPSNQATSLQSRKTHKQLFNSRCHNSN